MFAFVKHKLQNFLVALQFASFSPQNAFLVEFAPFHIPVFSSVTPVPQWKFCATAQLLVWFFVHV
jgi:hypothetical protein